MRAWVDPGYRTATIVLDGEIDPDTLARVIDSFRLKRVSMDPSAWRTPMNGQKSWADQIQERTRAKLVAKWRKK